MTFDDSKKRTRVTPAQLTILEDTFSLSATPDSKMRKQLACKLQMPERSIQIWFQNRRAKVKMLHKRAILRQEQEAARARLASSYWHPQPKMHPVQRAWSTDNMLQPFDPLLFTMPKRMESEPIQDSSINFPGILLGSSVTVGSWHRMKISQQDLLLFYDMNERIFSWHIQDSNYHFKMVIPFDIIASIVLEDAQIDMDLLKPPIFYMENADTWTQCSDFTEGTQASIVLRHTIRGLAADLFQSLTILSQDPKLHLITQFPSLPYHHMVQNQNWRHQSVPLTTTSDFWINPSSTPSYPI